MKNVLVVLVTALAFFSAYSHLVFGDYHWALTTFFKLTHAIVTATGMATI